MLTAETHQDYIDLIEDVTAYFCQENMVSGETCWNILECYSTAKVLEFSGCFNEHQ